MAIVVCKMFMYMWKLNICIAHSAGAVEYTNCISAESKTLSATSVLDMTLNNLMVRFLWCWIFGESLPGLLWPGVVAPDRVLSMGQIELNCVLRLNWIVWNITVLIFNCVWTKIILIQNWIVWLNWIAWNRNIFDN